MARLNLKSYAWQSLVIWNVLFVCGSAAAQDYSARIRNLPTDRAYQKLLHATIFNLGGVGFAMQITPEEEAFKELFESGNSIKEFQRLLNQANPEGQLYALFGLHLKAPDIFRKESEKLKVDDGPPKRAEKFIFIEKGQVRIADGCMIYTQDRRKVIDQIAKGEFDTRFKSSPRIVTH
ncbi:MAG: hypothetical protein AABM67_03000 [Acidobacteriota bacterium]